ncbi:hypothetical protein N7462_008283 [Penicillium macrosclerotiorum]|uniref:uncharacterized protein n=1 Tax=Penicillium macrosclerotiorum TaxID=303699 RepID=UPI00254804C7|nr:uncharacterized protein N7462_008283 [Penicillium macrosclerotiorum]KAJ5675386.1 hypothetical protein N7462_008283 [Penicillium macrosclerotiorum]
MSQVRPEVFDPQRIRTIPLALRSNVEGMLQDRIRKGVFERCHSSYRNPWFLVKKKVAGTYRIVTAAMKLNLVTIRDANIPPGADEFVEEFSGMPVMSLVDLFSGYDQLPLDERDRDMTAIQTPISLLRQTTILQGATNSIAQIQRVLEWILQSIYGKKVRGYLDDLPIKGPKTIYNGEFSFPGVRRFVLEHIQNLDHTLYLLELAGMVISAEKS